jgi:hypothetical protein
MNRLERTKAFVLGALTAIGIVAIVGAAGTQQVGRYQTSASGDPNFAYAMDTVSGEYKRVTAIGKFQTP